MRVIARALVIIVGGLVGVAAVLRPLPAAAQASVGVVPLLIPISGQFTTPSGESRTGAVLLVLSLYEEHADTAPRWIEQQEVVLDPEGRYTLQFGAAFDGGLPVDLFTNEPGVKWLGVAISGEPEQPRMPLVSVPYAAKAISADTLAGRSVSDFILASTFRDDLRTVLQEEGMAVSSGSDTITTAAVTENYLQKGAPGGTGTTDSTAYEIGGNVGIGTTSPLSKLHVMATDIPTLNLYSNSALRISSSDAVAADKGGSFSLGGVVGTDGQAGFAAIKGAKENGVGNNYDGYLMFTTTKHAVGSREAMRISSAGNVGIGTTSPLSKLHVMGTDVATVLLYATSALRISSSDAMAANRGGSFSLGGAVGTQGQAGFAAIKGAKENGLNNNYDGYLMFTTTKDGVGSREAMRITSDGNIGIGTSAPAAKLHIAGNVVVDGNIGAKYQDVAEWVDSSEPLDPGSVVVIDREATNRVTVSTHEYDTAVAGAVSSQPGLVLGEEGVGRVLVAQSGRVRVKADARYGAIRAGDLVVSSPTRGHVMRSRPVKIGGETVHRPGTVVGKALESLASGQGQILVLLTLQ